MSALFSTDPSRATAAGPQLGRRALTLALLALGALAACGKKGSLRLPRPDEIEPDDQKAAP